MANYEVWLYTDSGTKLKYIDRYEKLEYTMVLHDIGVCTLTLAGDFDVSLLRIDYRLIVLRSPKEGVSPKLERTYLIRKVIDQTDSAGTRRIVVTAYDGNDLLKRRIVAYDEGLTQSEFTETAADNILKQVVLDNLGTAAGTAGRQIGTAYLSVQAQGSAGPPLTKSFPWQNVLRVCQDIANSAKGAGTPVYWDMVPTSETTWEFRTRLGQLNQDHSSGSGTAKVTLGYEYGNLSEPVWENDYSEEITYAYVPDDAAEQQDAARLGRSVFGRREGYAEALDEDTTTGFTAATDKLLAEGKPRIRLSGKATDTPGIQYGLHYGFGDKVTASYAGKQSDSIINAVHVVKEPDGRDDLDIKLETGE